MRSGFHFFVAPAVWGSYDWFIKEREWEKRNEQRGARERFFEGRVTAFSKRGPKGNRERQSSGEYRGTRYGAGASGTKRASEGNRTPTSPKREK